MAALAFRIFVSAYPRIVEDIFSDDDLAALHALGEVRIHRGDTITEAEFQQQAKDAHVIMGVFDMPAERLAQCPNLRAVINLEGNFMPNIDYDHCFRHGIRVMAVSHVFAWPVAEIGLAMAIDLGRGITRSDRLMRQRQEQWGLKANERALTLFGAQVGFIGFGDLGRALLPLLKPFGVTVGIYDPWLPDLLIQKAGCTPANLDQVLSENDYIFVLAGATKDNLNFLGREQFNKIKDGAAFLLLSRANVVNFPDMVDVARTGRIKIATDVFPDEPVAVDHPVRDIDDILLSPHQAGALNQALKEIGKAVVADVRLIASGLPPMVLKQAQPETASRLRSKPVAES